MSKQGSIRMSIRARIYILAIVPVVVVSIMIAYFTTVARIHDITQALNERGNALANHLASASEFGLFASNLTMLRSLAESARRQPDVQDVIILDETNHVVVKASSSVSTNTPDLTKRASLLQFEAPVLPTGLSLSDFDSQPYRQVRSIGRIKITISNRSTLARQKQIVLYTTMITMLGVVLSMLLAWRIGKAINRPINELAISVQKLRDGQLETHTSVSDIPELEILERGFNEMVKSLRDAQALLQSRIVDATNELRKTVEELEIKNQELERARHEALSAGQAKSDFLARMSHEIRTPLNAVIGFARLLEKTHRETDRQEYTQTIVRAASQLLCIIDDILNFSKLESGAIVLEHRLFELTAVFEDVFDMLAKPAYEKNLELILQIDSDVPSHVIGDPTRFSQVLTNLIGNAVKFTTAGFIMVEVSVVENDSSYIVLNVSVRDTGIGLSQVDQDRLFRPFSQAEDPVSRHFGGTGLGLAISKRLVEAMEGTIGVQSVVGDGSTFWFNVRLRCEELTSKVESLPIMQGNALVYADNPLVRRVLRNKLMTWGMSVFGTDTLLSFPHPEVSVGPMTGDITVVIASLTAEEWFSGNWVNALTNPICNHFIVLVPEINADSARLDEIPNHIKLSVLQKPTRTDRLRQELEYLLGASQKSAEVVVATATANQPIPIELKTLIVEDNQFNRSLLELLLTNLGCSVLSATSPEEALSLLGNTKIDLVLTDLHMPGINGIELARHISALYKNQADKPSVVAVTADVFVSEAQLHEAGISDCLYKPVDELKLADLIRRLTKRGLLTKQFAGHNKSEKGHVPALTDDFLQRLDNEIALSLRRLQEAVSVQSHQQIREEVHQLRGLLSYHNNDHLRRVGTDFDILARAEQWDALAERINSIESVLQPVAG